MPKPTQNLVEVLAATIDHFFPDLNHWFSQVTDARNQELIIYHRETLLWVMLITLLTKQGARQQINNKMRLEEKVLANLKQLCEQEGLPNIPHGDTVEYLSIRLKPEEIEAIITKLIKRLIRTRVLEKYRLLNEYYMVAIDGVHVYSFDYPHCGKCLVKKDKNGKKKWFHYKLQMSLITSTGLCLPLASEWIENEENYVKQDCELKAFYRLIKKLRQHHPQLKICVVLDGLYACQPVFETLAQENLEWIVVFKEGSMPEKYKWLMSLKDESNPEVINRREVKKIAMRQKRIHQERLQRENPQHLTREVVKETSYTCFTAKHWDEGRYNIMMCNEVEDGKTNCSYAWLVSDGLTLCKKNLVELAEGGRCRWKIENEGNNVQKNGGYQLEHLYSRDEVSMKIWNLMLDIAHIINQLIEKGSLISKKIYGTIKNIATKMFEHFCYYSFEKPKQRQSIQIRLCWNTS